MIEIVFLSTSRTKFAHLSYGLDGSNYEVVSQNKYGIGYKEPRIYNREELLKISYVSAKKRFLTRKLFGKLKVYTHVHKFFILEDTSVRIDAISDNKEEIPGLDIKYWMKNRTFNQVDKVLKERGNNRKCTVRSDILLHLPHELQLKYKKEYMIFTGKQNGFICKQEKTFDTNFLYPWLDNKTFNKWFVPDDYEAEDIVISQLDIESATKYDFRYHAIKQLMDFLDKEDLDEYEKQNKSIPMPNLFESVTFLLLGSTCAGKSTLAEYMAETYGYYHIEASDFMYLEYHRRHGANPDVAIGDFAQGILEKNPIVVAKQVVEFCNKLGSASVIISGFRTVQEIEYFKNNHQKNIQTLYIDTKQEIRYKRCKDRNRKDAASTYKEFQIKDSQQFKMGVKGLEALIESKLQNNGNFSEYYDAFELAYASLVKRYSIKPTKDIKDMRLEELILITLSDHAEKSYTTTEIAKLINKKFPSLKPKSKNNVSRYFNQSFHPYYDISAETGTNRYSINTTGLSQARLLKM